MNNFLELLAKIVATALDVLITTAAAVAIILASAFGGAGTVATPTPTATPGGWPSSWAAATATAATPIATPCVPRPTDSCGIPIPTSSPSELALAWPECQDPDKGTVYYTVNPFVWAFVSNGGSRIELNPFYAYDELVVEDDQGVDWSLLENCYGPGKAAAILYASGRAFFMVLEPGFNPGALYQAPFMGAKKIRLIHPALQAATWIEVIDP